MIIKRLKLKNFRRYRDVEIEFPNGPIGIVGRNGIGKSTILEAIGWALYGQIAVRTNQEGIKTTGVDGKCSVTLEIVINDLAVRIDREISNGGMASAKLFLNNSVQAKIHGSEAVRKYVEKEITRMNSKSFFNSIFAKQKELSVFSDMNTGERKKMIEKLLGIDMIEKAQTNIRRNKRSKSDRVDLISNQFEDIDQIKKQLVNITLKKKKHQQKYNKMEDQITIAYSVSEKSKSTFNKLEKKYEIYQKESKTLGEIKIREKNEYKNIKDNETRIGSATRATNELKNLTRDIKNYHETLEKTKIWSQLYRNYAQMQSIVTERSRCILDVKENKQSLGSCQKKLGSAKYSTQNIRQNESILQTLKNEQVEKKEEIARMCESHNNYKSNRNKKEKEQSRMKTLERKSKCPICKRLLGSQYDSVMQSIQKQIIGIDKSIKEIVQKKTKMNKVVKNLDQQIEDSEKHLRNISEENLKRKKIETEINIFKKNIKKSYKRKLDLDKKIKIHKGQNYSKKEHDTLKAKHSKFKKKYERSIAIKNESKTLPALIKKQKNYEGQMSMIREEKSKHENMIKNIHFDKLEYNKSKHAYESSKENYQQLEKDKVTIEGDIRVANVKIMHINEQIVKNKNLEQERLDLSKNIAILAKLDNIMNEFRMDLMSRIRPSLSYKTGILLGNLTRGKYPIVELDDEYNIKIKDGNDNFGIDRFSGGEIDLVNLCLRIAISNELAERAGNSTDGFIVLDEIFGSQDSERKTNILEQMLTLENQFKQIILITHIEDVRDKLPYVLFIKEKSNGEIFVEKQGKPNFVTNVV